MVSMPRCGCRGKPARSSSGISLRKSSRRRNGSKSDVLPKPKARRKCTPAPSRVGLDLINRLMGRSDILVSSELWPGGEQVEFAIAAWEFHEEQATIETRFVKTAIVAGAFH